VTAADPRGAIGFAEKVLELLDEGRYTATYKYAVLLALIDVCLERTQASGAAPEMVTTRQLADKVVEHYWPHSMPFAGLAPIAVLNQSTLGQAEIVSAIMRFRERHTPDPSVPRWEARTAASDAYERLVRRVEWKLIEMPLPRLQVMGQVQRPFIYEIFWDQKVTQREVKRYQAGESSDFDNRVLFKPDVGDYFLQLSGLLRPLIQRRWAAMVAELNRLEESQLEVFLFGADRIRTARIRAGLWEIQERRCFYCDRKIGEPVDGEVDHFLPWSRYPDDGLDNLVVADRRCNRFKSSSLAAADHLTRWAGRLAVNASADGQLADLAKRVAWARRDGRSLSVARAIYLRLPDDARLWLRGKEFVAPDAATIGGALA
jgi:5-methylcytosine-specific restriction endonuclease McrA